MVDIVHEDVHELVAGLALHQLGPALLPALHHLARAQCVSAGSRSCHL